MQASIEHPEGSGILIRQIFNRTTTADGQRKAFGSSWQVVIPAKKTHGKGRVRKQCDSLDEAEKWAEGQAKGLKKAGSAYLDLTDSQRVKVASAFHLANEAEVDLLTLTMDALAAVKILGTTEKLAGAALFYQSRKGDVKAVTVLDAVDQLLREKEQDGVSAVHAKDLRLRLGCFSEKFGLLNTSDLDAQEIDGWLRGLDVGKRSRVNYRRVVLTFIRFCERRGWLARGAIDGGAISKPKVKASGPIGIFTEAELRTLLERSGDKLRPYFVLGGLCGLRTAESLRLDWSEIDFNRNTVTIAAGKAKTASRRIIPLCEAAKQWLLPLREQSGRVLPYYHVAKEVDRLLARLKKAGTPVEWKTNGLRHTYVSARMAIIKDAGKVAGEAGNSAQMIFTNYRELMHDDVAAAWFAVMPKEAGSIVKFPKAAVA